MKRLMSALVVVAMVGCGGTETTRSLDDQVEAPGGGTVPEAPATPGQETPAAPEPGAPAAPDPEVTQQGLPATLRLQGVDLGAYTAVLAHVRSIDVVVDGVAREVRLENDVFDLAQTGHAWKIGAFTIPEGAREVSVSLRFDDFGGYETADGAGILDLRVAPLQFTAPADYFVEHGHAVVQIEVARSLKERAGGRLLLPSIQVRH